MEYYQGCFLTQLTQLHVHTYVIHATLQAAIVIFVHFGFNCKNATKETTNDKNC